ncbi:MAG TPA: 16S rRNA (uracil(1498)-N(3))-methyltransferase [Vicinamibacterales bacterium]|jgi:16S rRNA (uracil1498-N3)-methyltransferase|nr:16S rRNA (uracil(1498)-N(3))-methyltransferase [Vicinamibacterales bacterium]
MAPRFFAPSMDPGDEDVLLPRDEAEHLTRVLRLTVGDTVAVFDGRGNEFLARVAAADRRDVRVQILSRVQPAAEPAVPLTLVQAVLKSDRMDEIVRDAVMLGVAAIQPVVTARAEVTVAALLRGARVDRWKRVALASVKQSRRAVLPEIRTPLTFDTFLSEPLPELALMLVEPTAAADAEPFAAIRAAQTPHDACVIVGPEGGWTEAEWAGARRSGIRLVTLGHRTLRADAVPIAAISVLQFVWGDL